jgi:hypothetical protein
VRLRAFARYSWLKAHFEDVPAKALLKLGNGIPAAMLNHRGDY